MPQNQHASRTSKLASLLQVSAFETQLGWLAISACDGKLTQVRIGHRSEEAVLHAFVVDEELTETRIDLTDWNSELRDQLIRFADGEPVSFESVELSWPRPLTPFRRRVIAETRRISWGTTLTYGEVARRAGSPGAARAVGTVMSSNRFPFIVPCHRVVGSSGGLGGFTAPGGTGLKQRLLAMENVGNDFSLAFTSGGSVKT
ncbi:MAG: methylated-DNA--[protein]-cysteine S-methyltransferase [Planctomycetota bacterium]|nr:methylated-DNA--[protein]-cysteine S-methyltransferase [Planctomycetota bacterium]MDA1161668.1 methylated-DNA--[protein]-cysteine S-methyltransferase [Planctomycetota bacterium]